MTGFDPLWVKPMIMKLIAIVSPLSTQHQGERTKTGLLKIKITCSNEATCLLVTVVLVR